MDAHHKLLSSTTFLAELRPSQADECVISVEVLSASSSGEHKFKVSGIMVAESADPRGRFGIKVDMLEHFARLNHGMDA